MPDLRPPAFSLEKLKGKPEDIIEQALRNAKRLLNAESPARGTSDVGIDMVKVTVRHVKPKKRVMIMQWYDRLAEAVALNFCVKHWQFSEGDSYF